MAVVAGDTKVVGRGDCDGIYLAATGIGFRPRGRRLGLDRIRAGDRILVSGPIGEHGAAVMLARQEFGLRGDLQSDAASVLAQAQALMSGTRPAFHARSDARRALRPWRTRSRARPA